MTKQEDRRLAVLDAIIRGSDAWSHAHEIACLMQIEADELVEWLDELIRLRVIDQFVDPRGVISYTLTIESAEMLGVELIEVGCGETTVWVKRRKREPRHRKSFTHNQHPSIRCASRDLGDVNGDLEDLASKEPGPDMLAEWADLAERWKPRGPIDPDELPKPWHLLYYDGWPWVESSRDKQVCLSCRGLPLSFGSYCLECERHWLDSKKRKR